MGTGKVLKLEVLRRDVGHTTTDIVVLVQQKRRPFVVLQTWEGGHAIVVITEAKRLLIPYVTCIVKSVLIPTIVPICLGARKSVLKGRRHVITGHHHIIAIHEVSSKIGPSTWQNRLLEAGLTKCSRACCTIIVCALVKRLLLIRHLIFEFIFNYLFSNH